MLPYCTLYLHSNTFTWTHLDTVLVLHIGRSWLNTRAAWNTGTHVENTELQVFSYCTLKGKESNHAWRKLFFADLNPAFSVFKDFFQLTLPHSSAHMSDFDVLRWYVKFQLLLCGQVKDAVDVSLDAAVKTKQIDVVG